MSKTELRKEIKRKIDGLKDKPLLSSAACERLMNLPEYKNAASVMLYMPLADEVDTSRLFDDCIKNKKLFVPHVENGIRPVAVEVGTEFIAAAYGIAEPKRRVYADKNEIDLAVVPLRAFDSSKNRLGRGKGMYDGFLKDFRGAKIGLAFSVQELDSVNALAHDVPLDAVVTEEKVIK